MVSGPSSEQQYQYSELHNGDARAWAPKPFDVAEEPNSYTADCQHPKDREEADLCQQWRAAKAAEKAANLAETQVYWNLLQLISVVFTGWAAFAAASAARSARLAVEQSDKNSEKQLRAYVMVDETAVLEDPYEPRRLRGKITIKNSGVTPATNVRQWIGFGIRPHPLTESFPPCDDEVINTSCAVGGGGQFVSGFDRQFTLEEWAEVMSGKDFRFHVFGRIEYDYIGGSDVFPFSFTLGYHPFKKELCLVWRGTDHGPDRK